MKHLSLSVFANAPLAIRADHATGGAKTAQYIPGATLLGSLASAHRLLRPEKKEEFANFFLNEQIYYPHLYPALFDENIIEISDPYLPVTPLPKTAQSCKRFSGFRPLPEEDTDDPRHGARDSLFDWAIFSLLNKQYNEAQFIPTLLAPLGRHAECTICHQVMDHFNGYYRSMPGSLSQRMKAKVNTHLQMRTGINRDWGVVEEGILYNREVFDEGMRFWGDLVLLDELSEELVENFYTFLEEADDEDVVRIGTGRTRGLGRVNITSREETHEDNEKLADFNERIFNFQATLEKVAKQAEVELPAPFYFAVTLYTPTILCDSFLRYHNTIDGKTLGKYIAHPGVTFQQEYQSTGVQRITGWNELWGTPRTNDYAMEIGSTFLFSCSERPDETLLQKLYTLEESGLGRRRAEGFGRIRISDLFHQQGEQA